MKLLNLGCGSQRPSDPDWTNLDDWEGGGHEINEANFLRHDLRNPLPFEERSVDGVLCSHLIEHLDAQEGLKLFRECHRVLHHGGVLLISVPDASYFRSVYPEDRNENWPRLFEVSDPPNPIPTFFEAALWFDQHKTLLTEDSLWAYFVRAGFNHGKTSRLNVRDSEGRIVNLSREEPSPNMHVLDTMIQQLNRLKFSLIMCATKD